jgi:NAD(P)-dependent dehydrogenase (short-subunit alcohol dehydrogenase family)
VKYDLSNKVVVITGAGSGIGRALAKKLADFNCRFALADIDASALEETAKELPDQPLIVRLDVSDREDFNRFAARVFETFGHVDVVINNAGVALSQRAEFTNLDDFEWLMGINFWGVVYGTTAFLPCILKRNEGVIVNVSSLYGLVGMSSQGAYAAAKHAVRGYTESLRLELLDTGVHALCVHPGGVKTNIVRGARIYERDGTRPESKVDFIARFDKTAFTSAATAADIIVSGIRNLNPRIIVGRDAKLIDFLQRLAPTMTSTLLTRLKPAARKGMQQDKPAISEGDA